MGGRRVAAIAHDPALDDEPQLVRAAAAAAALALENQRLEAELRARIEELRTSRARLVEAGDTARRRLERDLHDGAQSRIVTVMLKLRLAQMKVEGSPEAAELLDEASADLRDSLEELRELARGIHPAILADRGLAAALGALAERAPVPVSLSVDEVPRAVEAAIYFVVAEGLTNVAKYAHASSAAVAVRRDASGVVGRDRRRRRRRRGRGGRLGAPRTHRPRRRARRAALGGEPAGRGHEAVRGDPVLGCPNFEADPPGFRAGRGGRLRVGHRAGRRRRRRPRR